MWPDDEKAAENTCCIVKGFEEVWAHFCPPKPYLPLSTDTNEYKVNHIRAAENISRPEFFRAQGSRNYFPLFSCCIN